MKYKSLIIAALLGLSVCGSAMAAASTAETGGAGTYAMATFSASDAVAAVESTSGGKVVELVLEDQGGAPAYQVTAVKPDGAELTFLVDGVSGKVAAADDVPDNGAMAEPDGKESGESSSDADSSSEDAD